MKESKKVRRPGAKPMFDWDRGRELYDQGANDREIARALGTTPPSVCRWRSQAGLPSNWKKNEARKEQPEQPEKMAAETTAETPRPARTTPEEEQKRGEAGG
jgi:hypothetical protein